MDPAYPERGPAYPQQSPAYPNQGPAYPDRDQAYPDQGGPAFADQGDPAYPDHADPIARVTHGMRVLDATGEEIGTVDQVQTSGPGEPGHITVDRKGLFTGHVTATADQIEAVHEDVVQLAVSRDALTDQA